MDEAARSRVMSHNRSTGTRPETVLRSALAHAGVRGYRCNYRSLRGCPDLAFTRWKVAVFVDGVWWHGRSDCYRPATLSSYWRAKIGGNIRRDTIVTATLLGEGWQVVRFWDKDVVVDGGRAAVRAIEEALSHAKAALKPRSGA
jgi:DNA mismatch endonuclease (patch repair protein)